MISTAQFRADYPEFSDATKYPDSMINYYLGMGRLFLNQNVWGTEGTGGATATEYDIGLELMVAHNIVLEAKNAQDNTNGTIPGGNVGPVSSKSVDKVSVSYDTGIATEKDGGHWNLTSYGIRFLRLARMFGTAPVFVGADYDPTTSGPAWIGPWSYVFPNPS